MTANISPKDRVGTSIHEASWAIWGDRTVTGPGVESKIDVPDFASPMSRPKVSILSYKRIRQWMGHCMLTRDLTEHHKPSLQHRGHVMWTEIAEELEMVTLPLQYHRRTFLSYAKRMNRTCWHGACSRWRETTKMVYLADFCAKRLSRTLGGGRVFLHGSRI